MLFRFTKLWVALGLLIALWGMSVVRRADSSTWIRPVGSKRGPVKITQFYATVGLLTAGDKALLCYGVENARSVRISPELDNAIYPALSRCLEIGPQHTTHYSILAEGYDGAVATRSVTLTVQPVPEIKQTVNYAGFGR